MNVEADDKPSDAPFFDTLEYVPHDLDDNLLFYFDPSDGIDIDCPGVAFKVTFTNTADPVDTWPPELGINSPSILDQPTFEENDERDAMLNHVLGID